VFGDELSKTYYEFKLNFFMMVAPLSLGKIKKKFRKVLVDTPIRFLITQNGLKMRKIWGLKLERGLELIFSKKIETNYHLSSSCVFFVASLLTNSQRTFVALQFACPMTKKLINLV
jgi:hypothetical protein